MPFVLGRSTGLPPLATFDSDFRRISWKTILGEEYTQPQEEPTEFAKLVGDLSSMDQQALQ